MSREIGLHTRMDAHLKLPPHELAYFQEYLKNGGAQDEIKMTKLGEILSEKIESSRDFFLKVLNENEFYFKSVHPAMYKYGSMEFSELQIIGKFLLFWYVMRPYNAIASCEHKFTYHSIQHAFFEYSAFLDMMRVPTLIQHWSHYYVSLNQQQMQASFLQLKSTYEQLKVSMESLVTDHDTKIKSLESKATQFEQKTVFLEKELESSKAEKLEYKAKLESSKAELDLTIRDYNAKILDCTSKKNELEQKLDLKSKLVISIEKDNRDLKKKFDVLDSKARKFKSVESELSLARRDLLQKDQSILELESKCMLLQSKLDDAGKSVPTNTNKEVKSLKNELLKSKKMISDLEELLITSPSKSKIVLQKDIVDNNIDEARVLVDLMGTNLRSEKIVFVLQNYVVSSMKERPDEEFPAWLVVAQSLLKSICADIGLAKGFLSGRFLSSTHGDERREDVFMGLLCWKVESRYRALSWLRNRVVRGFSSSGAMGDVKLSSFHKYISEQQKTAGKITLSSGKTSPELSLEMSTLEVLRRETTLLIDNETFYPVSGSVFIPTVPSSLANALFAAVKNFALLNVCCFVTLMESDGDKVKKILLDILFELYDSSCSAKLDLDENKFLSPVLLTRAHDKIVSSFPSFPRMKVLLKQICACSDAFQDLYSKTFLFFEEHSGSQEEYFCQKRMLTLHTHVESLLDSFWASQEVSRHSEKVRGDLPDSMTGKIMAMEVLWNEESDKIIASKKHLDGLLLSLSSPDEKVEIKTCTAQTNTFMQSLSHLLIEGKLIVSDFATSKDNKNSTTEEILGYICNEMKSSDLREFLAAIQESIYSFKEVKKGKQVMVEGKSSLGKILQSLVIDENKK
jgi:hypothetical protein